MMSGLFNIRPDMKISVFAASSSKVAQEFFTAASDLGKLIAQQNHEVVFGGGGIGLMSTLADSAIKYGGKVIGVIPEFMVKNGWGHDSISETIVTTDMNSRKKKIFEISDAVVSLPGGVGTLEELTEAITLKQLGLFNGPIVILNSNGFYNKLIEYFDQLADQNFMRNEHKKIWELVNIPEEALTYINNYNDWDTNYVKIARI
jgi:uncharacterized protein (TIGR00730 family)